MEVWLSKVLRASFFLLAAVCGSASCGASQTDVATQYREQLHQLAETKQFIGSSVIGGLMWPILLTLTVSAMMARVPDILQRLLTGVAGGGGGLHNIKYRSKRSSIPEDQLDEIFKLLKLSFNKFEKV